MIVLDEQLGDPLIITLIERWYSGAVIIVRDLRPHARLLDPEIPHYLLQLRQPTFVTINHNHSWKREMTHRCYSLVCLKLGQNETTRVPSALLREVFSTSLFRTKLQRMGKAISWSKSEIKYFEL